MFAIQFLLVLSAFIFAAVSGYHNFLKAKTPNLMKMIPSLAVLGLVIFVINPSFGQVPSGFRGVVLRFGAATGEVKSEGLYMVTPFMNSVQPMNVQVHADKSSNTAASHDLQNVTTEVTVNYRLDPKRVAEIYRDLREEYKERVMIPAIQEAIKATTAQFDAQDLIIKRPIVKDQIETYLQAKLFKHGIIVDGIAITDFKFSEDFANAIEAKVTSLQLALKAENDLNIRKAEAQQTIETAKAEAERIRIQANAINSQGGADYVHMKAIEKWNGVLPVWVTGGGSVPFINIAPPK